jgi:hypothetical protein
MFVPRPLQVKSSAPAGRARPSAPPSACRSYFDSASLLQQLGAMPEARAKATT